MSKRLGNLLLLHFTVFIWGFTGTIGKLISLDALSLVWYRTLIAVVTLGLIGLFYIKFKKMQPIEFLKLLGTGGVIALHWLTFFYAIKISNVSVTLACLSSASFFTAILDPLINKSPFKIYQLVLGIVVMAALFMIFNVESQYRTGIFVSLLSAILSSLFTVLNGTFVKKYRTIAVAWIELAGAFLLVTVFLLFKGGFNENFFEINRQDVFWLLLLGTICTALAYVAGVYVLKEINPFTVSLTVNLEPVYGIVIAYLLFKQSETMTKGFYFGALVIILTLIANAYLANKQKK
jgi:drug/metabolite transporter (DMT)-like permease